MNIVETCTIYRAFEALTSHPLSGEARRTAMQSVAGQVSGILDALLAMARGGVVSCDIVKSMVAAHDAFSEGLTRLEGDSHNAPRAILEARLLAWVGARNLAHALELAERQCARRCA